MDNLLLAVSIVLALEILFAALGLVLAIRLRTALRQIFKSQKEVLGQTRTASRKLHTVQLKANELTRLQSDTQSLIDRHLWSELESLLAIYRMMDGKSFFGSTRGWAMSPDVLLHLTKAIQHRKPLTVVECGSGTSTLVMAFALRALNQNSRLISLEHDLSFCSEIEAQLKLRGLCDIAAVLYAPIEPKRYDGFDHAFNWYGFDDSQLPEEIDMLVIDGPPGKLNVLARYPAGPELFPRLSQKARVYLDDTKRSDEKKLPALWERQFPNLESRKLKAEKGALELCVAGSSVE